MGEPSNPAPSFGDALEKYSHDQQATPSSPNVSTPKPRAAKKWNQLPFPGRTQPSSSSLTSKPSTTTTTTLLSPSPIKSRKLSSQTSSLTSKKKQSSIRSGSGGNNRNNAYAPPSKYSSLTNLLTDSIAPGLITLFIGLNPGIQTATSGHAYAHPSNLFWRLVHRSGCTPRLCRPTEDGDMPRLYNLGLTNIVTRPTKSGGELSKGEMDEGVAELERKIALYRPESVAVVGKSIWESIWRVKHGRGIRKEEFRYGWQGDGERMGRSRRGGGGAGGGLGGGGAVKIEGGREGVKIEEDGGNENEDQDGNQWKGALVFVATTTSGLAASMSLTEKEEIWSELGSWVEQRRKERAEVAAGVTVAVAAADVKGEDGDNEIFKIKDESTES